MQFKRTLSLVLTAAIAAPAAAQSPGAGPQGDPSSAEVLARHVADLGTGALRTGALDDPATWAHAATLFAAASRLDPREPRYWKGQAEARRHAGDVDAAVRALVAYRDPQRGNRPGEPVAMIALLDLYAGRIQSADERLKYFKQLLAEPSISDREVRSHVATLAAQLYFERSQFKDAADTVFQAIQLNPLNAAALRLQHDMIAARDGTPLERARNLLAMLRVNPAQVDVAIELADLLADAGLVRPALDWYAFVRDLAPKADAQLTRSFAVRYAAELYLADQHDAADGLAGQLLEADPSDVDALMLRLIARRGRSSPADYAALLQTARAALRGRVVQFARTGPTTQPAEPLAGDLPDLTADVDNLATSGDERQRYATASALADLAWFELYFARQPGDAAPLVELVAKLLPPDSVLLARLRGWQFVAQGRNDEARVKLSAVADRDPLAAMGLARAASADPATRADASGVGRAALAAHPAGLIGAVLWDGLKDFAFQRMVGPQADAVLDEVNAFDRRVLQIVDNPSAFYNVRGEPTQGAFAYNEPIYARVTVANTSDFPLAVGPGGVIRSDLWFDGELAGMSPQPIAGIAFDRIDQVLTLPPRRSIQQLVRIDAGALGPALAANPTRAFQVFVTVTSNPQPGGGGGMTPGPAGLRNRMPKLFARSGFPPANPAERRKVFEDANHGPPEIKFNALALIGAYAAGMMQPDLAPEARPLVGEFVGELLRGRTDPDPLIAAWASYLAVQSTDGAERERSLAMLRQSEAWPARLLYAAALAAGPDDAAGKAGLAELAEKDSDETVRAFAATALKAPRPQPATQPAPAEPPVAP